MGTLQIRLPADQIEEIVARVCSRLEERLTDRPPASVPTEELLDLDGVYAALGKPTPSRSTVYRHLREGVLPEPDIVRHLTPHSKIRLWKRQTVDAFVQALPATVEECLERWMGPTS